MLDYEYSFGYILCFFALKKKKNNNNNFYININIFRDLY